MGGGRLVSLLILRELNHLLAGVSLDPPLSRPVLANRRGANLTTFLSLARSTVLGVFIQGADVVVPLRCQPIAIDPHFFDDLIVVDRD